MNTLETFDATKNYSRHEKSHPLGGVHLKEDPNSTVNSRDVLLNLIKNVGGKLKEGKLLDLLKVSRPAIISYPRTYLECVVGDFQYTHLLDQASTTTDPVERLKLLTAFFVSGLHRNSVEMGNNGPLNPILGETFNAEKEDGTNLYCEQISHHPPVSAYLMVHPKGLYKLHGSGEVAAKMGGINQICGSRIGETTIDFKDGGKVKISNPEMRIDGVIMGDRTINYAKTFELNDVVNNITAEISFNYTEQGALKKIGSAFKGLFGGSATTKPLNDTFTVTIIQTTRNEESNAVLRSILSRGSGSWLSYVEFEKKVYWKVADKINDPWICNGSTKLESDSTFREDSKNIRLKKYDQAQKEKDSLENLQRNDAKLRKGNKPKPTGKALG